MQLQCNVINLHYMESLEKYFRFRKGYRVTLQDGLKAFLC